MITLYYLLYYRQEQISYPYGDQNYENKSATTLIFKIHIKIINTNQNTKIKQKKQN